MKELLEGIIKLLEKIPNKTVKSIVLYIIIVLVMGFVIMYLLEQGEKVYSKLEKHFNKTILVSVQYKGYEHKPDGILLINDTKCEKTHDVSDTIDKFECSVANIENYRYRYLHRGVEIASMELNNSNAYPQLVVERKPLDVREFSYSLDNKNNFSGKFKLYELDSNKLHKASKKLALKICSEDIEIITPNDDKSIQFTTSWRKFSSMYYDNCQNAVDISIVEDSIPVKKQFEKVYFFADDNSYFKPLNSNHVRFEKKEIKFFSAKHIFRNELTILKRCDKNFKLRFRIAHMDSDASAQVQIFDDSNTIKIEGGRIAFNNVFEPNSNIIHGGAPYDVEIEKNSTSVQVVLQKGTSRRTASYKLLNSNDKELPVKLGFYCQKIKSGKQMLGISNISIEPK